VATKKSKRKKTTVDEDYFDGLDKAPPPLFKGAPLPCPYNCWPDDVPILTERDMTWNYSAQNRRFDLLMWLDLVFGSDMCRDNPKHAKARQMLAQVIAERLGREKLSLWRFLEETMKTRKPSLAWQAAAWNFTMKQLGYDIPKASYRTPED
jgi:hypothetical protein